MKNVPTLDIRRYDTDRDAFVAEIGAAYREFGFCCISGHGIPRELIDGSYDVFQRFFALPTDTKMKYHIAGSGGARGYTPFKVETAKDSQYADLKEFWHIGREIPRNAKFAEGDLVTGGLSIKYIQPIAPHLELYLRGTASLGAADQELQGYSGRGLGAGAGIQLKGKGSVLGLLWWPLFFLKQGPRMTAALWLDSGYEFYRLQPSDSQHGNAIDAQLSTLTVGFALGSDF